MHRILFALALAIPSVLAAYGGPRALLPRQESGDNDPTETCFNACTQPFFNSFGPLCENQVNTDSQDKCYCENGAVALLDQCIKKCAPANAPSEGAITPDELKAECAKLEKDDSIVVVGTGAGNSTKPETGNGGNGTDNGTGNKVGTGGDNGAAAGGDQGSGNGKDDAGNGGATGGGNSPGKSEDDDADNGATLGAGMVCGSILTVAVVIAAL